MRLPGNCSIIWPTEPVEGYTPIAGEVLHVTAMFLGHTKNVHRKVSRQFLEQAIRSHGLDQAPGPIDVLGHTTVGFSNNRALEMCPNKLTPIRSQMEYWLGIMGLQHDSPYWNWEPHVTLKHLGKDENIQLPTQLKLGKPIVWWKV